MKKLVLSIAVFAGITLAAHAQAPALFNYQGIARNAAGQPMAAQTLSMRLSVLDGSPNGTTVYQETQTAITNAYGLYNVAIGGGTVVTGTLSGVNWASGNKYIKVELDPAGGTAYVTLGTTQLLSVPFALNAASATAPTLTINGTTLSAGGNSVTLPAGPVGPQGPQGPTGPQGPAGSGQTLSISGSTLSISGGNSVTLPTGGGGVSGSGTTNFITKFTGTGAVGNSVIFDNGTNVAVGSTAPGAKLQVNGSQNVSATVGGLIFDHQAFIAQTGTTATTNVARGVIGFAGNSSLENHGLFGYAGGSSTGSANIGTFSIGYPAATNTSPSYGVYANAGNGSTNIGIFGTTLATGTGNFAGYFTGNVQVTGSIAKGSGTFKIDHPLDPENKYLYHSFVESPDMMNIYNGNATTDASGYATVTMPSYFEALNSDYRYQLTAIGTFAQAIVSKEMSGNQFVIQTSQPNVKVSWQVTGIRQDKFANAHRVVPEVEKEAANKGLYLHAEEWGQPASKSIDSRLKRDMPAGVRK